MTGTWEYLLDGQFLLDPEVSVEVYRWHAPQGCGSCSVDFQAPKEAPHRCFYPVEVLEALKAGKPADDYVERMCRLGIALLPEAEQAMRQLVLEVTGTNDAYTGKEIPTPEALEFLLAIFESRREGHQRVTRAFYREDDFFATERSRKKEDFLVPGLSPPPRPSTQQASVRDIIRHIAKSLAGNCAPGGKLEDLELSLLLSPLRTSLDQLLVEGVLRKEVAAQALTISDLVQRVAPALIDGIDVKEDSQVIDEHSEEFRHFVHRLIRKYFAEKTGFRSWLRQEREKGFVRLFQGFKKFSKTEQEAARDKGKRFFRHVLWSAYEAMSRSFGVVALHMWLSFCQSGVIRPSPDERRAFRFYNAPLALAAGMPLWFFGPNLLSWVLEGFIDMVWGRDEGQGVDSLSTLIGLYGATAHQRRQVDARKKREKKIAGNRPGLLAGAQGVQFEEARDGKMVASPIRTVLPEELLEDADADCPDLPSSRACFCGGRLVPVSKPASMPPWVLVETVCAACGREQTYRLAHPA